jgi:hypothetical protein
MNPWPYFLAAVIVLGFLLVSGRERFQPEFLDKTQVDKTVAVEDSSYRQVTNHTDPAPYNMGPVAGVPTPFRVNQYSAYIV